MTNLIKADLGRIIKDPLLYIFTALPIAQLVFDAMDLRKEDPFERINGLWDSLAVPAALFFSLAALILVCGCFLSVCLYFCSNKGSPR